MSLLARPTNGAQVKDVLLRLRTGQKVKSHAGSDPTELAARVYTDGTYVDSRNEVMFADAIKGPTGPRGPTGSAEVALTIRGTLVAGVGIVPLPFLSNKTILLVSAAVATAPTGQAVIFDIKKNGVSIFSTVRLTIQPGETLAVPVVPAVPAIVIGDKLTVDVIQVGTIQPGAYATIVIEVA